MKKCPFCSKYLMHQRAIICIHCGRNVVTGEAIPVAAPSKKTPVSQPPKISQGTQPPKVSSTAPASEKPPRGTGRKVFYMLKLTGAIALVIFAGACLFDAYRNYKAQEAENAVPDTTNTTANASNGYSTAPQKAALAGNASETKEIVDEAAAEKSLKTIDECNVDILPFQASRTDSREIKTSISGYIRFKPEREQPLRIKIYRSAASDGQYSLIYNEIFNDFHKPVIKPPQSPIELIKENIARMKESQKRSQNPALKQSIALIERRLKEMEQQDALVKKNGQKINMVSTTIANISTIGASLSFNVLDGAPLDCTSNNVFYKIKLCSDSGLPLIESNPMKVPLVPRVVMADDLKTWTWMPFFPGKDPLDGALQNGQTATPVSNVSVTGQLAGVLPKANQANPPIYFKPTAPQSNYWRFNRSGQDQFSSSPDAVEVKPVFKEICLFEIKGQIELKSLKIDGRKVSMQTDGTNVYTRINGGETMLSGRKVRLNYPGAQVAELEFAYGGKTDTLRVQLPPVPTGLQAVLLDDGSVKLTWDALADRIDRKQFASPPDIKLIRDQNVIHTCDINQTEFIDKQTEPGRIHTYSMVLDDADAKVQVWTKEKGLTESKILLKDLKNPYPDSSKSTVYIYPEKPAARPVRVSFWEPALCYERTGGPGMRLFSAAVRKLGQADFEVLDRISRNNVIEEKVLTMSYEKSIMIQSLPADFTVLVRDYSRQQGNGVELWLIQNKTFDYKEVKRPNDWRSQPTHVNNDFLAWRIGSINANELKIPEKADEIAGKLEAEIKRLAAFKSAASPKDASVPVKFVFNALKAVRQKTMVVDDNAIGESIMIGLSNLMPGCNIMTRDNWKTIFGEQDLMREQGEKLENDISGTVLISGRVWQENDKKQYAFTLTDIRSGICAGAVLCSGTVEEVTAKLADACKKIKLVTPAGSEANEQTKAELQRERWTIFDCFMKRFGLSNTENTYKSLTSRQEMNIPEFAEKQWQLGNRENAVKILEKTLKTSKSFWRQLNGYYCKMGNYTRALQIVEAVMQQQASSALIPEYYRLRAMVARNAPPEISTTPSPDKAGRKAGADGVAAGNEVVLGITDNAGFHKTRENSFVNEDLDEEYAERQTPVGQEWNPAGECRTWVKYLKFGALKYSEYLNRDEVQKNGIWATAFEDRNITADKHEAVYVSLALWESEPLFGNNDSIALTRSLKLAESTGRTMEIMHDDCSYKFDKTKTSLIRTYLEIAKNPDMKFIPIEKKFVPYNPDAEKRSGYGSGRYDEDGRLQNREYAECDSGRKYMELRLKRIIKERQEKYGKIKLADMICIAIMARLGSSAAEDLLSEIDTIELPSSFENLHNLQTRYETYDLLAFKVYRSDRTACELALKSLRAGRCCLGYRDAMADIYYLMAKTGKKEIITAMLSDSECKDKESIAAIRWGDPKMLKSLLLEHPELFELDLYFYLIDGLNDPVFRDDLLNHQAILQNVSDEYRIKSVLWLGKPLPELYREQTLNYKRSE